MSDKDGSAASTRLAEWTAAVEACVKDLSVLAQPADFQTTLLYFASNAPQVPSGAVGSYHPACIATVDNPLEMDLTEAARSLREGKLSSEELVGLALERLLAVDDATNAAEWIDTEGSLTKARVADEAIRSSPHNRSELLGIPLAHKSLVFRSGHRANCGSALGDLLEDQETATILGRLEDVGSITLGRLHMTELAFEPSGANPQVGDCRNPWMLDRVPGGSSSGSAVAVATGAVFGSLGSDTGGSIRIPAALCGVTGLKPTYGRVSRHGAMPLSNSHDHLGPLCRSARDCYLLLKEIAGADALDPTTITEAPELDRWQPLRSLEGIRIGVSHGFFREELDERIAARLDASLSALQEGGATIVKVPDFPYDTLNALASMIVRVEAGAAHHFSLTSNRHRYSDALVGRLQEAAEVPAALYETARNLRGHLLRRYLTTVLRDVHALHAPVVRVPTPELRDAQPDSPRAAWVGKELTRLTRPFNFLGLPALSLPCGLIEVTDGVEMPTGFQLVGHPCQERTLLQIGDLYQAITDWHHRRPAREWKSVASGATGASLETETDAR